MFGKKKEPEMPVKIEPAVVQPEEPAEPPKPVFRPADFTKIGEGIVMVGNFDTKDPVEIKGIVRGNIRSTNSISIGRNGALIGEAAMDSLNVEGRIEGTILCSSDTSFSSSGSMRGNLSTGTLRTDAGSNFEGKLNMIPKKPAPQPAPKKEAPEAPEAKPAE